MNKNLLRQRLSVMLVALTTCLSMQSQTFTHYSEWMAYTQKSYVYNSDYWRYDDGLMYESILDTYEQYKNGSGNFTDETLKNAVKTYIDACVKSDGSITNYKSGDLDDIRPARMVYKYYKLYGGDNLKKACQTVMACNAFKDNVRVIDQSTGYPWQHKSDYANQVWLDGIFMGIPYWTLAGPDSEFGSSLHTDWTANDYFDDAVSQMQKTDEKTYEPTIGLWCHAWDATSPISMFWATKTGSFLTNDYKNLHSDYELIAHDGRSSHCWGRALGWYAMAIMETMDNIAAVNGASDSRISTLKALFKKVMDKVVETRDPSAGVWRCVIDVDATLSPYKDYSNKNNYLEATCSAMFTYCLLHGVAQGYLDSSYLPVAKDSYNKFITQFITNNGTNLSMSNCMSVGGLGPNSNTKRDGSYAYYMSESIVNNDSKGVGPFIWASLEAEKTYGYTIGSGFSTAVANNEIVQFRWSKVAEEATVGNYTSPTFTAKTLDGTAVTTGLSFSSDNTSVATVASDGTVSLVGGGTATITATHSSYAGEAKYTVVVKAADTTAPTLSSTTPAGNATDIATSGTVVLTFDEAVTVANASGITISPSTGVTWGTATVDASDNKKVNITYSGLSNSTQYTVTIANNAITDASGNAYAGSNFSFTTVMTQVATPTITGTTPFTENTTATITCVTDGATIHYTTDGSTPTNSSTTYSSPIAISATTTVKAIAVKSGMTDSEVASQTFTKSATPSSNVLFYQDFNSATEVAYTANTAYNITSSSNNSIVGTTDSSTQFTTITCNAKNDCGIGINSTTGGNSKSYKGKFGAYYNNTGGYWSIVKKTNFATTAPTAIKVEMNAAFSYIASGSNIGVQFAVGSSFSDGLTNSCPALSNCVAGFALPSNSTIRIAKYAASNGNAAINSSSATLTNGTSYKYTWVINNTDETLTYEGPDGKNTTVASKCWDLWIGTTRNLTGITQTTTGMSGTSLNNLYIGSPFGKKHEFILDSLVVTDLSPSSATTYTITATSNNNSYGTVTTSPTTAAAGATVTITTTPATGYELTALTAKDASNNDITITNNQFTMPASNVTVNATFAAEVAKVATPTITPADGTVFEGTTQSVSISCGTSGASIYYTDDGTEPTTSSMAYSSAFTIYGTKTIKAIAVKSGMTNSDVATATITNTCLNEYTAGGEGSSIILNSSNDDQDNTIGSHTTSWGTVTLNNPDSKNGGVSGSYKKFGSTTWTLTLPTGYTASSITFTGKCNGTTSDKSTTITNVNGETLETAYTFNYSNSSDSEHTYNFATPQNEITFTVEGYQLLLTITLTAPDSDGTLILKEAATEYTPIAATGVDVTLVRTLQANKWNALCLPFDVTPAMFSNATNGAETQIETLQQVKNNTFIFAAVNEVAAGTPFIAKPVANIANPVFEDVQIKAVSAGTVTKDEYSFKGNYTKVTLDPTIHLFISMSQQKLVSPTGSNILQGLRGYFIVPEGSDAKAGLDFDGEVIVTDIDQLNAEHLPFVIDDNTPIYNLSGQRVSKSYKGIVIIKGKKIVR